MRNGAGMAKAFPRRRLRPGQWLADDQLISDAAWGLVADVSDYYPRLLVWLSEGQVGGVWNVFGVWLSVLRLIPGVRWLVWYFMFKPVADVAPWRVALYASILQRRRSTLNKEPVSSEQNHASSDKKKILHPGVGLSAVTEEAVVLPTKVRADLSQRIVTLSSGCIGISGLRGAGKSTLIQDFCAQRYGTPREPGSARTADFLAGLRIMVQAPLEFDAREFLIHQYTCLCRAVLADVRFNPTTFGRQLLFLLGPKRIRLGALLGALSGFIFFAACAALAYLADTRTWPRPFDDLFAWEVAGAVLAFTAGAAAFCWRTGQAVREIRQVINLASDAEDRLRRLHYQRTDSRSAGGTLSAPVGAGISIGTSHEFTQQLMSLPELIDDYRDFVQRVVGGLEQAEWDQQARADREQVRRKKWKKRREWWAAKDGKRPWARWPWVHWLMSPGTQCVSLVVHGGGEPKDKSGAYDRGNDVRLVIGIDQMDQIHDAKAARRFLDELSAEFGVPNCVYLLAVSPKTMAAVDQRTVPLKTSSGGLFDEMIWVEPFGFLKSRELLNSRVVGLRPTLIALCYVLSGGLPRELLRVARLIVRAVPPTQKATGDVDAVNIEHVVEAVIKDEVTALKHRALASTAGHDVHETLGLLEQQLTDDGWPWDTMEPDPRSVVGSILEHVQEPVASPPLPAQRAADDETKDAAFAAEICNNLIAGLYYLFTVRELFLQDRKLIERLITATTAVEEGRKATSGRPCILSDLARARVALGVGPDLAADLVSAARKAMKFENPDLIGAIQIQFLDRPAEVSPQRASAL